MLEGPGQKLLYFFQISINEVTQKTAHGKKKITKIKQILTNCPIQLKNCNFEEFFFPDKLCIIEKIYVSKQIKIPYILTVLLSIFLNELPCVKQTMR